MDINPVNINDKKCEEMWARFVQYLKIKNRKITNIDLINYKNIIRKIINKEPVPPEYYRIAIEYLNCAHYDYLATKILFRNNIFSNSVYHLQQASEKMMKSLCLILGYTDPEKLKSTHITPQPLLALLQSKPSSDIQNICSNIANKNYRNELKKVVKIVNNNIIDQKKLREMPYKSTCRELGIETIIKIYDLIGDGNQALKVNVEQIYKELIEVFPEWKEQIHKDKSLIIGQLTAMLFIRCYYVHT
jgi:hypothetical protein